MLRRVARVMRVLLAGLGLCALLWLPMSYAFTIAIEFPSEGRFLAFRIEDGAAAIGVVGPDDQGSRAQLHDTRIDLTSPNAWRPERTSVKFANIHLVVLTTPLWLLAAVCLAWPVTSSLVRRRRRGRGFAVETKAAGDSAADPPDAAGGRG